MYFHRDIFEEKAREQGKSNAFIESSLAYVDKLNSMQLPVIFSLKHLAVTLDISYKKISHMIKFPNEYYNTFRLRKKSGGVRIIQAPKPELKIIQKWIYVHILKNIKVDSSCTGFTVGSSTSKVARMHQNKEVVLKLDLENFYDNIDRNQVYYVFKSIGYKDHVAIDLAKLTTVNPIKTQRNVFILPQGAPSSPSLSNLVSRNLDRRLRLLSEKVNVIYTRYADDLTFSGEKKNMPSLKLVTKIISEEGFQVNNKKTSYQKKGNKQIVLGLTVSNDVHVPKKFKREIWTHIKYCKKYGPVKHLININQANRASYKDWLYGRICYVKSVELKVGEKMMEEFNLIDWPF
ncbi:reverse transcriptase family protein [Aquibacillus saliphilus]|uniref:reverse transcriptase family protein n=1 Tax=Aquibacillus saliphilus TaxID=1909422 RepID=UPI001CF0774F|nr:reverse transcriptase family protein [Aquibacillus saliphilus]